MAAEWGSLPFKEQIRFYLDKLALTTRVWTDVYAAEHEIAFMVAGATKAALLSDLHEAVRKAIEDGTTIAQFRKDFDALVEKHGWSYQGGRNWRTRVIYDTNVRQSYNAGRERQMVDPELRRRRPFALYQHGDSVHPRPMHLEWDGTVLPVDDPWWNTHSPSNGWGCKCRKFMLNARDVARRGLTVAEQAPPIEWQEKVVGKNGPSPRTVRVPEGIDPGFEYRPGESRPERTKAEILRRAEGMPEPIRKALVKELDARGAA